MVTSAGLKSGDRVAVRVGASTVDATVIEVYGEGEAERVVVRLHTSELEDSDEDPTARLPPKALELIFA